MDFYMQGYIGEMLYFEKIRPRLGKMNPIQQLDGLEKNEDGTYTAIEIKFKNEMFVSPPFDGHGLDVNQINLRMQLYKDLHIRTKLVILDLKNNAIFWQYIDVLESLGDGIDKFTTAGSRSGNYSNCKRIYRLTKFVKLDFKLSDIYRQQCSWEQGIELFNKYKKLPDGAKDFFDDYYKEA